MSEESLRRRLDRWANGRALQSGPKRALARHWKHLS